MGKEGVLGCWVGESRQKAGTDKEAGTGGGGCNGAGPVSSLGS